MKDNMIDGILIDLYKSAILHGEAQAHGVLPTQKQREDTIVLAKLLLNKLIAAKVEEAYSRVDRFEVIDDTGRAYVKGSIYGSPVKIDLSLQDDDRTLKVFVEERKEKEGK